MTRASRLLMAVHLVALCLLTACRTVEPQKLTAFSSAVSTTKLQANQAFTAVNGLTSDAVLDYVAAQPNLLDKYFVEVLDQSSIDYWENTFFSLEQYSLGLAQLTSGEFGKANEDSMVALASQIKGTGERLKTAKLTNAAYFPSAGLAAGFTKLSGLILDAKGQSEARKIIAQADPAIQDIMATMANAIGNSNSEGIRGTVQVNWSVVEAAQKTAFLQAKSLTGKRAVAKAYAEIKIKQNAQDRALASLQRSCKALAQAHRALASGSNFEVGTAIETLKNETGDLNVIFDKFNTIKNSSGGAQ